MTMPATGEVKHGFWVGLGVVGAFIVLGFVQAMVIRAAHRNG